MPPLRKSMPSFTLVLTSRHHSLLPTTDQFDSYASPTMLRTAPDYLMKTIDLRDNAKDACWGSCDKDGDTQTIFEAIKPTTIDDGAELASSNSIKQNFLLLIRRFVSYTRNLTNKGPLVAP